MAITYLDKWPLNIQHSLHEYLSGLLNVDWVDGSNNPIVQIAEEFPDDELVVMPEKYATIPASERYRYVRLPAIAILMPTVTPEAYIGLGEKGQWNHLPIQIYVAAISHSQRQVLMQYIANRFKDKFIDIKDYDKYPDPGALVVGVLETMNPATFEDNSLERSDSAFRYGGAVSFTGKFVNTA